MYLLKIFFNDYKTIVKRIFYLFIMLSFTSAMFSFAFYNLIGSLSWGFNQLKDAEYVGILNEEELKNAEVNGYAQMMGELIVAKPNIKDPVYLPNSTHTNAILSNEEQISLVLGKGNILYTNKKANQLPKAWIDYNTAQRLKLSLNDTVWVLYIKEEENGKPVRLDLEFQLYGLIRPYFGLLANLYNNKLVVLEKTGLNEYLQKYDDYVTYPLSSNVIKDKIYYVTVKNNLIDYESGNIFNKRQLLIKSLLQTYFEQPIGVVFIIIPVALFFTSSILAFLIIYREYVRNHKGLLYNISLLNTIGLRTNVVKAYLLLYQLSIFLISITTAIIMNKFIVYELYLGMFFYKELVPLNFMFYALILAIIIFSTKHLKSINNNNIFTYQVERGGQ